MISREEALIKYNQIDRRVSIKPFWEVRDIIEDLCNHFETELKEKDAEINRLRKQIARGHDQLCECSFCAGVSDD